MVAAVVLFGFGLGTRLSHISDSSSTAPAAVLKAAEHVPSPDLPSDDDPLLLNTARTVYQWHTRAKTGRTPQLQQAAPDPSVELAPEDAERLGIADGDLVAVESARRKLEAPARLTGIREGVVFVPFHYQGAVREDSP